MQALVVEEARTPAVETLRNIANRYPPPPQDSPPPTHTLNPRPRLPRSCHLLYLGVRRICVTPG
jgi:hypothetical protein